MSLDRLALLGTAQDEFLTLLRTADPRVPVPCCGSWTVRDLAVHLSRVHHWAAAQARRQTETPLGRGPFDLPELYGRCAAELRTTLADLPPDAPAWTLVEHGVVAFWHRRQLHETLVHLGDLQAARALAGEVSRPGRPWTHVVTSEVWADAVDEVVTVLHPRQVRLGRCAPLPAAIRLTDAEDDRTWSPEHAPGAPAVEVSGPASALALLLWRRIGPDDPAVQVVGDRAALQAALALGLTP